MPLSNKFGSALAVRVEQLRRRGGDIDEIIKRVQGNATSAAVIEATNLTPPNETSGPHGTGTVTGQTKARWAWASRTTSIKWNDMIYETILGNDLQWVSYLNDGHRMDKHFVPGLIINPYNGLLEKVDPALGGIMVGTQTQYVIGRYMREGALEVYKKLLYDGLTDELKKLGDD